jgi:hypothetical protein
MKETDIRPLELMKRYVELSAKGADLCFNGRQRRDFPCVSYGSENIIKEFSKSGFEYASRNDCGALYQTPRPPIKGFEKLFERAKLTDVKISTPGQLGVDIVKNFVTSSDGSVLQNNRFLKSILDSDNKSDKFQDFLSSN